MTPLRFFLHFIVTHEPIQINVSYIILTDLVPEMNLWNKWTGSRPLPVVLTQNWVATKKLSIFLSMHSHPLPPVQPILKWWCRNISKHKRSIVTHSTLKLKPLHRRQEKKNLQKCVFKLYKIESLSAGSHREHAGDWRALLMRPADSLGWSEWAPSTCITF